MTKSFFDKHPRFFETGLTGGGNYLKSGERSPRLHNRHVAIVKANAAIFREAKVLDIGSHDGRWSLAALDAGVNHVTGIEGRSEAVEVATQTFEYYNIPHMSYLFECGDAIDQMRKWDADFDLILCLGFMYHTPRHWDLFECFRRLGASHVILDTKVNSDHKASTSYTTEPSSKPGCAIPEAHDRGVSVVGVPSRNLLQFFADHFGFGISEINWRKLGIGDWRGCSDYLSGSRRTYVLKRKAS